MVTRVLLAIDGTTGDVLPMTGLGAALRSAGYEVTMATQARFAGHVRAAGLTFHQLPGDMQTWLHGTEPERFAAMDPVDGWRAMHRAFEARCIEVADRLTDAAQQGADVLLLSPLSEVPGTHVAEALGLPTMGLYLRPSELPAEAAPLEIMTPLEVTANPWSDILARRGFDVMHAGAARKIRARLGLPPLSQSAWRRRQAATGWPICYGYSPAVVEPTELRPGSEVVGYWWPVWPPAWQPEPGLTAFLDAGEPPIFVGLGSLPGDPERTADAVATALRALGRRAVVQAGWSGLVADTDDVFLLRDEVPYEWLFPRMAAVVHAAGASTVAAVVKAGVPSVPVAVAWDQPFWAQRVVDLGVAPGSIRFASLTSSELVALLEQACGDPVFQQRAAQLTVPVRADDGAGRTVARVGELRT